jgi:hypothetical protein
VNWRQARPRVESWQWLRSRQREGWWVSLADGQIDCFVCEYLVRNGMKQPRYRFIDLRMYFSYRFTELLAGMTFWLIVYGFAQRCCFWQRFQRQSVKTARIWSVYIFADASLFSRDTQSGIWISLKNQKHVAFLMFTPREPRKCKPFPDGFNHHNRITISAMEF